ncbi:hypothetical protein O6H91_14G057000 [Diphasiastrum complanatum]|uniref:Uncharacterized protein n=1 Tax=Diphasiastrum complanatum TaxID=34168 RepID=A0ACC2BPV5_DIPCM|nr:hypothetical protein O6H91_14G057000 [Diphasiastrum complanatum]
MLAGHKNTSSASAVLKRMDHLYKPNMAARASRRPMIKSMVAADHNLDSAAPTFWKAGDPILDLDHQKNLESFLVEVASRQPLPHKFFLNLRERERERERESGQFCGSTRFITNKKHELALFHIFSPLHLKKPTPTHFAYFFLVLVQLCVQQDHLRRMATTNAREVQRSHSKCTPFPDHSVWRGVPVMVE